MGEIEGSQYVRKPMSPMDCWPVAQLGTRMHWLVDANSVKSRKV